MVLSPPAGGPTALGVFGLVLVFLGVAYIAIAFVGAVAGLTYTPPENGHRQPWFRHNFFTNLYIQLPLLLLALALFLIGSNLYKTSGPSAVLKTLKQEISSQAETIYGVTLSEENTETLALVASEVVSNPIYGTSTTAPIMEDGNRVFVFQVSSTGAAKLLVSDLDFKEPETISGTVELLEPPLVEDSLEEGLGIEGLETE